MYCKCGYEIDVDSAWNGLVHRTLFRDKKTGQEINECPGCGESVSAWLEFGEDKLVLKPGALSNAFEPQGQIDRWRFNVEEHTGVKMTREQAVELAAKIIMSPKNAAQQAN